MDPLERATLVARYAAGHAEVLAALDGITEDELDRSPADGSWSPRQVVHHLADSEMTSAIRFRRLLTEEDPVVLGYDEEHWARALRYEDRPIGPALDAFAAARATTLQLLERMTADQWERAGTHSESGAYDVKRWLRIYAGHAHDHADQIRAARGRG